MLPPKRQVFMILPVCLEGSISERVPHFTALIFYFTGYFIALIVDRSLIR